MNSKNRKTRAAWRAKRRKRAAERALDAMSGQRMAVERALRGLGAPIDGFWTNEELRQAQRGRCYLCDNAIHYFNGPQNHGQSITREHVKPRAKRNGARLNILLAHRKCNNRKGDRSPRPCELLYLEAVNLIVASVRAGQAEARAIGSTP